MFGPMLLGYALGAVGVYTLLYRLAPVTVERVKAEEAKTAGTQVIHLFEDETRLGEAA